MSNNETSEIWIRRKQPESSYYSIYWQEFKQLGIVREHPNQNPRFYLHLDIEQFALDNDKSWLIYAEARDRQLRADSQNFNTLLVAETETLHESYHLIRQVQRAIVQSQTLKMDDPENPLCKYWKSCNEAQRREILSGRKNNLHTYFVPRKLRKTPRMSIAQMEQKLAQIHTSYCDVSMLRYVKINSWLENLPKYFQKHAQAGNTS